MGIKSFFKKAFSDMKESAKAQHEVDKANLAAAKAVLCRQYADVREEEGYIRIYDGFYDYAPCVHVY